MTGSPPAGGAADDAGKQYFGEVVSLYEGQSKTFRTLLSGLLVFGVSFLFLVLIPFVRVHHERALVERQLDDLDTRSRRLAAQVAAYGAATRAFDTLRLTVLRGPQELRGALPALLSPSVSTVRANAPPPFQQTAPQPVPGQEPESCGPPGDSPDWANCRVGAFVQNQFRQYRTMLDAAVLKPLQNLPADTGLSPSSFGSGLDSLQQAFQRELAENPSFWERYSGKVDFFDHLRRRLDGWWQSYGLEDKAAALRAEGTRLDSVASQLRQEQKTLETGEQQLALRLSELDSPLGKLPVGLVEAVQIFPVLVAIAFVWCVVVLRRLVALRQAVQAGYAQRGAAFADLTDRHLALAAPVWVDQPGLVGAALLWAPSAIFVIACALVGYYWSMGSRSGDALALGVWAYTVLYVAAAGGLYYATRQARGWARALRARR